MDDQILTFVLLAAGFVLLGIELMIPSGGVIGLFTIASFLGSAWFAYQAWAETNPLYWRIYMMTFLGMIPVTLYGIYYLLTKTAFGNRVLLAAPTNEEVTPYQAEHLHLESLIGKTGKAISPLCPGGLVQIDGERLHAIGDGFIIESGASVKVVETRGTRVVVVPVDESRPSQPQSETESESPEEINESPPIQPDSPPHTDKFVDPFLEADQS
ncbi:hypothetical protein N9153_01500 [Planctomicrobium sp.]|jgi:membrane-bound ClpP family serine protease|nr:hypothetical protein [Planctomicrobium sp.]MDB4439579.1 hypothetical protein [Planctomicrobium sp.]MDB4731406.1 hypothetical protein [bacterium]